MSQDYTAIELPDTVYHRRVSGKQWVHPMADPFMWDSTLDTPKQPCPLCQGPIVLPEGLESLTEPAKGSSR